MPHIFVSHATADDDTVTRIHDQLETATGRDLWVDHKDIALGDPWQAKIEAALRDAEDMIVVISRMSAVSIEVTTEWRDALARGVRLLVVIIDDIPFLDIPARLRQIQFVKLTDDWDTGVARLTAAINRAKTAPSNTVPADDSLGFYAWPITGRIDRRLTAIPISGREADLAAIKNLLKNNPTAILGVGGIGKSRLAVEIILTSDDIAGAVWHNISELSRPDEVLELLREHFKLEATASRKDTLAKLKTNKRLIVLDNAEDVLPDDPRRKDYVTLVEELIAASAQVLFTSRAEWNDIELCSPYTPKTLSHEAARKIVLDMAAAFTAKGDIAPHADELALAARLHPRLIEWVVKKLRKFTVDAVIKELKALKSKDVQNALHEMILETVDQMAQAEGSDMVATLKKLNVCRGGFTEEAAAAITGLSDDPDTLQSHLAVLQTWQFVSFDGTRYSIDPLVIAAVGEDVLAYNTHSDYFSSLILNIEGKESNNLKGEIANIQIAAKRLIAEGLRDIARPLVQFTTEHALDSENIELIINQRTLIHEMIFINTMKIAESCLALYYHLNEAVYLETAIQEFELLFEDSGKELPLKYYAQSQEKLGEIYQMISKRHDAITCWREAEKYYRQIGFVDDADEMLRAIADAERKLGGVES